MKTVPVGEGNRRKGVEVGVKAGEGFLREGVALPTPESASIRKTECLQRLDEEKRNEGKSTPRREHLKEKVTRQNKTTPQGDDPRKGKDKPTRYPEVKRKSKNRTKAKELRERGREEKRRAAYEAHQMTHYALTAEIHQRTTPTKGHRAVAGSRLGSSRITVSPA